MSTAEDSWERIKELFQRAIERPVAEREELLAGSGLEAAQLDEVRALIAAHDEAADDAELLKVEQQRSAGPIETSGATLDAPGAVIDRYKILQEIGEGGFGTVYMAEQQRPVRRMVAFKILKAGMDTRQVIARFEAERQALALMDHHNIARVFDAGSTVTGRPYFVMELVRGIPITEFCDKSNLSTEARLRLFIDVCSAIQHAHHKGIIHRDIKPSNVLVTLHDGVPVPKVIDFGIAKATDHRLTERTLFTEFRQMLGTPEYMAPEQAELSGLDVDTRADIYSLGVMLYEILTGTKPFDFKALIRQGYDAVLRHIREVEPPAPSTRFRTLVDAQAVDLAKRRSTDRRQLQSFLHGDLDHVVMKALSKDRARRYESASGLADDVRRFLAHEPVSAGPPTMRYRFGKLLRRHRGAAVACAAVLAALLIGLVAALWQASIARTNARDAERNEIAARKNEQRAEAGEQEAQALLVRALDAEQTLRSSLDAERDARRQAEGLRLSAQSIARAGEDPELALKLAIEGATMVPGDDANNALYTALDSHRTLARLEAHDGTLTCIALSPDDRRAFSSDSTRLLIVWDLEKRVPIYRFDVHEAEICGLGFLPDGSGTWSASKDGDLRIWSLKDGSQRGRVSHPPGLHTVSLHPDGRRLLTVSDDGVMRSFRLDASAPEFEVLHRCDAPIVAFNLAANGRLAALLDQEMRVHLVAIDPSREPLLIPLSRAEPPPYYNVDLWYRASVELDADAEVVLTRNRAGHAALWNTRTGALLCEYAGPGRFCGPVRLGPRAERVYLLRRDSDVVEPIGEIADARTGVTLAVLEGAPVGIRSTGIFSPDGRLLLTLPQPHGLMWNVGTGACIGKITGDPHGITEVRFDAEGQRLIGGGHEGRVYLWSATAYPTRFALSSYYSASGTQPFIRTSPDGNLAMVTMPSAAGSSTRRTTLLDTLSGRALCVLAEISSATDHGCFSPDGQRVAYCSWTTGGLRVWEVASRRLLFELTEGEWGYPAFNQDGRFLSARLGEETRCFDVDLNRETGRISAAWRLPVRISPDGRTLVVVDGPTATVTLWDVTSATPRERLSHQAFSFDGGYTPDGRYLVTVANDTTLKLYDAETLKVIGMGRVPTADYLGLAFSPDSRKVAVFGGQELLVFEVPDLRRFARWRDLRGYGTVSFSPHDDHLVVLDLRNNIRKLPLDPLAEAMARSSGPLTAEEMSRFGLGTPEERTRRDEEIANTHGSGRWWITRAFTRLRRGETDAAFEFLDNAARTRTRMLSDYHLARAAALVQRSATWNEDPDAATRCEADLSAAVTTLGSLLDQGYRNLDVLQRAREFQSLQGREDFEQLLARIR